MRIIFLGRLEAKLKAPGEVVVGLIATAGLKPDLPEQLMLESKKTVERTRVSR